MCAFLLNGSEITAGGIYIIYGICMKMFAWAVLLYENKTLQSGFFELGQDFTDLNELTVNHE